MKKLMTILAALLCFWLSLPAQELPSYFLENNYLQERLRQVPKGKHFLFITDYHQERSTHTSTAVLSYVKQQLGIDRIVFGGDCYDAARTPETAAVKLGKYFDLLYGIFGNGLIWVQGNHDCNSQAIKQYGLTPEQALVADSLCYALTVGKFTDHRHFDEPMLERYRSKPGLSPTDRAEALAWIKMHYWLDDPALKIRFIVFETNDRGYTSRHAVRGRNLFQEQIPFLEEALKTTPRGYTAVVAGHQMGSYPVGIPSKSYHECIIQAVARYRAATGNRVLLIGGHQHRDDALLYRSEGESFLQEEHPAGCAVGKGDVLVVWTNRDTWRGRSTDAKWAGREFKIFHADSPEMKKGTCEEICFDIVTLTRKGVVFTRIGAGAAPERTFIWKK